MFSQKGKWLIVGLIGLAAGSGFMAMRLHNGSTAAAGMQKTNMQLEAVMKRQSEESGPKASEAAAGSPAPSSGSGKQAVSYEGSAEGERRVADAGVTAGRGGTVPANEIAGVGENEKGPVEANEQKQPSPKPAKTPQKQSRQIDLNTASLQELMKLPGIGESKAKAIVAFREQSPFRTPKEITKVKGIGDKTYEALKDMIVVAGTNK
ncbi:helix-hairpin-helix domain-containing protein [Paenibacillus sp. MBLB4367]|uniref:ComEA family DNA-binding protein n=1 Tax=Paenibacillus sp. MBLB4367 TaxID=3384767 RepID=UPI00390822D3